MKIKRLLVPLAIAFNVLGCWVHWECVVKPLRNLVGWGKVMFPSPFYLFEAPIWFWHDLAYTLIIAGTIILSYFAMGGEE